MILIQFYYDFLLKHFHVYCDSSKKQIPDGNAPYSFSSNDGPAAEIVSNHQKWLKVEEHEQARTPGFGKHISVLTSLLILDGSNLIAYKKAVAVC